jgi:short-subunit dehydrogenase
MESQVENKIIFMTGATSGLGKISAMNAACDGATVIALARDNIKSGKLIEDYNRQYPDGSGKIEIIEGDLCSFDSVRSPAKKLRKNTL